VEILIELMEHTDPRVRASVFEALEGLTGLAIGADSARWTGWYREEMRWWDDEADSRLAAIEQGGGLEFVRSAREALERHLYRDRVAQAFARALTRADPEGLILACRALEQLRSSVAVPALVECLEDHDRGVRRAAWRALRAITGMNFPLSSSAWAKLAG
jgi:HEAT repeat protein